MIRSTLEQMYNLHTFLYYTKAKIAWKIQINNVAQTFTNDERINKEANLTETTYQKLLRSYHN